MSNTATSTPYGLKSSGGGFQTTTSLTHDASKALAEYVAGNIIAGIEKHLGPIFPREEISAQIGPHQTRMMIINARSDELCSKGLHRSRANEIAILENPLFGTRNEYEERHYQGLKQLFPEIFGDNQ